MRFADHDIMQIMMSYVDQVQVPSMTSQAQAPSMMSQIQPQFYSLSNLDFQIDGLMASTCQANGSSNMSSGSSIVDKPYVIMAQLIYEHSVLMSHPEPWMSHQSVGCEPTLDKPHGSSILDTKTPDTGSLLAHNSLKWLMRSQVWMSQQ